MSMFITPLVTSDFTAILRQIGDIMNLFQTFLLTQQAGVEKPTLFPFPFKMHLIFGIFGAVFFAYRFFTQKRPFQLIMAVAIPLSLIVWLSESKTLFYGLGIAEAVLILAAAVTSFIFKAPSADKAENAEKQADPDDDNDPDDDIDNNEEDKNSDENTDSPEE